MRKLLFTLLVLICGISRAATFTDDYNRANGSVGANYTLALGFAVNMQINSNELACSNSAQTNYIVSGSSFGNDQEAEITAVSGLGSGTDYAEVIARASGTSGTFNAYAVYTDGASGAGHTEIAQYVNGSSTVLKPVTTTFTSGDRLGIRVTGSNPVVIGLYKNGTLVDSYSDSAGSRIASGGSIGIGAYSDSGLRLDSLIGGDVGGTPATLTSPIPSGTLGTQNTATIGATTDQTSGTFYAVVDTAGNISGITASQVKAGQNNASAAAVDDCNASVSTSSPSCGVSGLSDSTGYSYAAVQNNTNGDSNVVTGTFTTASPGGGGTPVPVFLHYYRMMKQ